MTDVKHDTSSAASEPPPLDFPIAFTVTSFADGYWRAAHEVLRLLVPAAEQFLRERSGDPDVSRRAVYGLVARLEREILALTPLTSSGWNEDADPACHI